MNKLNAKTQSNEYVLYLNLELIKILHYKIVYQIDLFLNQRNVKTIPRVYADNGPGLENGPFGNMNVDIAYSLHFLIISRGYEYRCSISPPVPLSPRMIQKLPYIQIC